MEGGKQMVVDPTDLEERTMDGKVVVGINVHQEICCLQMAGKLLLEKDQVRVEQRKIKIARKTSKSPKKSLPAKRVRTA